jgi:hypothetical protein
MLALNCIVCFFKFRLIVGVQESIVNALYGISGIAVGVGNSNLRWQQDPC